VPTAFKPPRFYPVLDTTLLRRRSLHALVTAEILINAGIRILQYRHKQDWTQLDYDEASRICALCNQAGVLFVLNDRADYAHLLKSALHVGQDDLPPASARRIISDEVMGFSTHNRHQLLRAAEEPVEYLSIGPIFSTTSKVNPDPVVGVDGLKALQSLTDKPLVAIGGITLMNTREVFAAGADSVAIVSGILPENPTPKAIRERVGDWLSVTT